MRASSSARGALPASSSHVASCKRTYEAVDQIAGDQSLDLCSPVDEALCVDAVMLGRIIRAIDRTEHNLDGPRSPAFAGSLALGPPLAQPVDPLDPEISSSTIRCSRSLS